MTWKSELPYMPTLLWEGLGNIILVFYFFNLSEYCLHPKKIRIFNWRCSFVVKSLLSRGQALGSIFSTIHMDRIRNSYSFLGRHDIYIHFIRSWRQTKVQSHHKSPWGTMHLLVGFTGIGGLSTWVGGFQVSSTGKFSPSIVMTFPQLHTRTQFSQPSLPTHPNLPRPQAN